MNAFELSPHAALLSLSARQRVSIVLDRARSFSLGAVEESRAAAVTSKDGALFPELCQARQGSAVATVRHLARA